MSFLVLFRPGPAWRAGAPLEEQKVFMGGPCEDKSDLLSVVVLQAASETEAFGSIQDNPFVTQGVFGPPSAER